MLIRDVCGIYNSSHPVYIFFFVKIWYYGNCFAWDHMPAQTSLYVCTSQNEWNHTRNCSKRGFQGRIVLGQVMSFFLYMEDLEWCLVRGSFNSFKCRWSERSFDTPFPWSFFLPLHLACHISHTRKSYCTRGKCSAKYSYLRDLNYTWNSKELTFLHGGTKVAHLIVRNWISTD